MPIRKGWLSFNFITTVPSTMLNNWFSNMGVQLFMTGGIPFYGNTAMNKN